MDQLAHKRPAVQQLVVVQIVELSVVVEGASGCQGIEMPALGAVIQIEPVGKGVQSILALYRRISSQGQELQGTTHRLIKEHRAFVVIANIELSVGECEVVIDSLLICCPG